MMLAFLPIYFVQIMVSDGYVKILNMTTATDLVKPHNQDSNGHFDRLLESLFEENSCSDLMLHRTFPRFLRVRQLFVNSRTDTYETLLVNDTDPKSGYSMCLRNNSLDPMKACVIPDGWKCDGFSSCLTDECGCGKETFRCADGSGCITIGQVCDSRPDCLDYSDECPCHAYQNCLRSINLPDGEQSEVCFRSPNCSKIENSVVNHEALLKLRDKLIWKDDDIPLRGVNNSIKIDELADCRENETLWKFHCERLHQLSFMLAYNCSEDSSIEAVYKMDAPNFPETFVFCDGVKNCKSGADEENCPQMFYCKSDEQPIPKVLTCDSISDCSDSSDECDNCKISSVFSSQTDLIGHQGMVVILMAEVLAIICLNSYALVYHVRRFKGTEGSYYLQIDIINCITLVVYDIMMAIYLLIIFWKHWQYRGEYCSHDVIWRSSFLCKIAGAIFFAASHGAFQVIVATSFCRNYQCRNVFSGRGIKHIHFLPAFVATNIFNLAMALVPLIATLKTSKWTDMFVHEFFFTNNPLIRRGKQEDIASLVSIYKSVDITQQYSTSELFEQLRNLTSDGELFSPEHITSVGLYGASSLCYPDLFSTEPAILGYKVVYMIENSIYLAVMIICYVFLVREFFRSRSEVAPEATNIQQNPVAENQDKGFYLSVKVSIVIGSQLICWLPIHGAIISSFAGLSPGGIITDIFIANILPLNAIMNPLLHSDLLTKFIPYATHKISSLTAKFHNILTCFEITTSLAAPQTTEMKEVSNSQVEPSQQG